MIISRTPFRISLFGGGSDYPDWYRMHGGTVLATTIDKYCYISCRYLPPFFDHRYRIVYSRIENVTEIAEISHPAVKAVLGFMHCDRGLEIHHDGDLPARSGLGSSSSFTVGLVNALMALDGKYISKEDLAARCIHIEQNVIGESVGSQDQISAAFGGFNRIGFRKDDSFVVDPVILPRRRQQELEDSLMLFFTGFSRIAADIAKSKIANFKNRQGELTRMTQMVDEAIAILQSEDVELEKLGKLLDESWNYKKSLSDRVSTREIDDIYDAARSAGATGGKILGAGGGGFMLLFVPQQFQDSVKERLKTLIHVPFGFESSGSRIVVYQPNGLN